MDGRWEVGTLTSRWIDGRRWNDGCLDTWMVYESLESAGRVGDRIVVDIGDTVVEGIVVVEDVVVQFGLHVYFDVVVHRIFDGRTTLA